MPQFVVLWTDGLIFLLLFMAVGFGLYTAGKEHLRDPWRSVVESRVGIGALVVLLFYVTIACSTPSIFIQPCRNRSRVRG